MRPTRDQILMEIATTVAARGTCSRLRVGAVLARDGRALSMGYNGAPAGTPHCDHKCTCPWNGIRQTHSHSCRVNDACGWAVHAEVNAIAWAARYGVSTEGASLFTTHMPCVPCSQLIVNAGILRVVWLAPYRDQSGVEMLRHVGIEVSQGSVT